MKKKYSAPYEYEEHVAGVIPRAQRVPGSGSKHGNFDVASNPTDTAPGYRADCKLTNAASFRVSSEAFQAVKKKCEVGQIPLMFVKTGDGSSYAVIAEEDVKGLMEALEVSDEG